MQSIEKALKERAVESIAEKPPKEVERKFLVDISKLPVELLVNGINIDQVYVSIGPDGSELRIRRSSTNDKTEYVQTVKSDGDISRDEIEIPVPAAHFNVAYSDAAHPRIEKTRFAIEYNENVIEVDIYDGDLSGLVTAEVEFSAQSEQQALATAVAFTGPDWLGKEITKDKEFKNKNLAQPGSRAKLGGVALNLPEFRMHSGRAV